ncbi:MAG: methyltransferase domain-containing protein [Steroidobacteraceae bacterium]
MPTSTQWQLAREAAERYERILVPAILGPAARALVDGANLQPGQAILDIGCGTGAATRCAAEKVGLEGRAVGVDVNTGMIDIARSRSTAGAAEIEWHAASACQLPFDDQQFDVVLCAQTVQFLDDKPKALSEMLRVLRPGGHVAASLWSRIEENPYFDALLHAVDDHIGADVAQGLRAAFAFNDCEAICKLVSAAGFSQAQTRSQCLNLELPVPTQFVPEHVSATPMAGGFANASPAARAAVVRDVTDKMAPFASAGGICVPFAMQIATGIRK